jgi:hypothetical protein
VDLFRLSTLLVRPWFLISTVALTCALGCGGESTPPATDALDSSGDGASGVLVPGAWHYAQYTPTQDSCDGSVDGDGDFTVELVANGFRIVRTSNAASTCTVDANDNFQCTTPDEVRDLRPGTDALMTGRLSLSGHVTNTTLASGTQSFVVTCVGSECNTVDPGACSVTATIALAKK